MQHFYFLLALLALFVLLTVLSLWQSIRRRTRLPYTVRQALLMPSEQAFLSALDGVLGPGYRIYGKTPLAALISVQPNLSRRERLRAADRLIERHVDFAVCETVGSEIVCAIELTRLPPGTRSTRLARLCDAAGLPLARIRRKESYSTEEIRTALVSALHQQGRRARFATASDAAEAATMSPDTHQDRIDTPGQVSHPRRRVEPAGIRSDTSVKASKRPTLRREPTLHVSRPVTGEPAPRRDSADAAGDQHAPEAQS